jgi:hypothetical protein
VLLRRPLDKPARLTRCAYTWDGVDLEQRYRIHLRDIANARRWAAPPSNATAPTRAGCPTGDRNPGSLQV